MDKPRKPVEPFVAPNPSSAPQTPAQPPTESGNGAPGKASDVPKSSKPRRKSKGKPRHAAALRNLQRGRHPKGSPSHEEVLKRREQITILRYDYNLTEREISVQLGMSIGRVSEELKEINKEFNKPLDPSGRNRFIQEHDRHYRFMVGKVYQDIGQTTRGSRERMSHIAELRACIGQHERFMAQVGLVKDAPLQLEVKHEETVNEEALLRLAEDILARRSQAVSQPKDGDPKSGS